MTKQEAAIVETYTGIVMLTGNDRKYLYEYASQLMGRPIFTHEFLIFAQELKEKSKPDFIKICKDLKIDERDKQIENLKCLLKLAVEDLHYYTDENNIHFLCDICCKNPVDCAEKDECYFEWEHADEVKELLDDDEK